MLIIKEKVKIIDNFLTHEQWKSIYDTVYGPNFPWYRFKYLRDDMYNPDAKPEDNLYFYHNVYSDYEPKSNVINLISPIIDIIEPVSLVNIRINFTDKKNDHTIPGFHTDTNFLGKTAVYYINTNNGKTILEGGTEVDSIANRIVIFDSNILHTPMLSTDKERVLINLNYVERV